MTNQVENSLFQTGTIADSEGAIESYLYISNPHLPDISKKRIISPPY